MRKLTARLLQSGPAIELVVFAVASSNSDGKLSERKRYKSLDGNHDEGLETDGVILWLVAGLEFGKC